MYTDDSILGFKFILLLVIIVCLYVLFSMVMRKIFKVNRKEFFSYNHINDTHKKWDWTTRAIFIVIFFTLVIIYSINNFMITTMFLQPWFIMIILIFTSGVIRVWMEWKYAENRNDFKYTISELIFILILFVVLFTTDFLWLI